jgi:hypothetical protein
MMAVGVWALPAGGTVGGGAVVVDAGGGGFTVVAGCFAGCF